jgi:hypothetical protein
MYLWQYISIIYFFFFFFFFLPDDMSVNKGIILEHLELPHTTLPHNLQWCLRLINVKEFLATNIRNKANACIIGGCITRKKDKLSLFGHLPT